MKNYSAKSKLEKSLSGTSQIFKIGHLVSILQCIKQRHIFLLNRYTTPNILNAVTIHLHKRKTSPKSLLEALDDSINELKSFSNLQDVFLVKLPPRCDIASVNHKVNIYNQLLDGSLY